MELSDRKRVDRQHPELLFPNAVRRKKRRVDEIHIKAIPLKSIVFRALLDKLPVLELFNVRKERPRVDVDAQESIVLSVEKMASPTRISVISCARNSKSNVMENVPANPNSQKSPNHQNNANVRRFGNQSAESTNRRMATDVWLIVRRTSSSAKGHAHADQDKFQNFHTHDDHLVDLLNDLLDVRLDDCLDDQLVDRLAVQSMEFLQTVHNNRSTFPDQPTIYTFRQK